MRVQTRSSRRGRAYRRVRGVDYSQETVTGMTSPWDQEGRRDPVGIVKSRGSDRPLRCRRHARVGADSTRLPLQTRRFGASAPTGSFYPLRSPLRTRSRRSDTVTTLLHLKSHARPIRALAPIAHYASLASYGRPRPPNCAPETMAAYWVGFRDGAAPVLVSAQGRARSGPTAPPRSPRCGAAGRSLGSVRGGFRAAAP